ncbi:MAG: GNAT family N-acetyltransferase [Gemmatimonadaceae bacterium]
MTPRTTEFRIRLATAGDAPLLTGVSAALFAQAFAADNRPEDMAAYLAGAFAEDKQRAELEDPEGRVWLAEGPQGEPVGYAHLRLGARSPAVHSARPAELARIYADRAWHGRGVGPELLAACIGAARAWEADVLWLAVWERNARAIAFYERHGFRAVGSQSFRLGTDDQRDRVMARPLDRGAEAGTEAGAEAAADEESAGAEGDVASTPAGKRSRDGT